MPSAKSAPPKVAIPLDKLSPTQARIEQVSRMPTGERPIFFSRKSAQKRRQNMIVEVQMNRKRPFSEVNRLPVMFVIQPSVPSSTAPTMACAINSTNSNHDPMEKRVIIATAINKTPATPYDAAAGQPSG